MISNFNIHFFRMFLWSDFLKFNGKITQFSMETSSLFSSEPRKALRKTGSNVCEKRRETVSHEFLQAVVSRFRGAFFTAFGEFLTILFFACDVFFPYDRISLKVSDPVFCKIPKESNKLNE